MTFAVPFDIYRSQSSLGPTNACEAFEERAADAWIKHHRNGESKQRACALSSDALASVLVDVGSEQNYGLPKFDLREVPNSDS